MQNKVTHTFTSCQWPSGDPQEKDFSFCGATNDGVLYFDASAERVGIGAGRTAAPGHTLDVFGEARISSYLDV